MAGIKDVAEKSGVSISTVSYVMSGKRSVRDDTKRKVIEVLLDIVIAAGRDQRKERTKRENAAQPEKTHIRPIYYPPRQKATGIWSPGKELLSGIQKKLLLSSLRDATHSPSGTFVPPPPAGGVFLTEGGSGEKERCSILPNAPSLRELARRKT